MWAESSRGAMSAGIRRSRTRMVMAIAKTPSVRAVRRSNPFELPLSAKPTPYRQPLVIPYTTSRYEKAAPLWGHGPTLIKLARYRTKHNQRSGRVLPDARLEDRVGDLMVVSSPLCTVPSAYGSTSCGEPRGILGICG